MRRGLWRSLSFLFLARLLPHYDFGVPVQSSFLHSDSHVLPSLESQLEDAGADGSLPMACVLETNPRYNSVERWDTEK